ncbi:hypothetical protein N7454_005715 [Penicillium verhagenii]|nr:hypothetical protein N7454_005715 [Penicillium verhagenii]
MELIPDSLGFSEEEGYESPTNLKGKILAADERIHRFHQTWRVHWSVDDAKFWERTARVESIYLEGSELERKLSLCMFRGDETIWKSSDQAKAITEQVRENKAARSTLNVQGVTSMAGVQQPYSEYGKSNCSRLAKQLEFRNKLIEQFQAKHPTYDYLWCPVMREWTDPSMISVIHLFPAMHGQAAMDAIFGGKSVSELYSARNGLLMSRAIADHFKSGKLAIVPISNDSILTKLAHRFWPGGTREYKIKILDPTWELRNKPISLCHELTFGDLDDRNLVFRSDFRPAACYLYFSYCVQILRSAWQHDYQELVSQNAENLDRGTGTQLWGLSGRYICRSMLQVFVEELGRDYQSLLDGAKTCLIESASNQTLLETVTTSEVLSICIVRPRIRIR